jgi:hypothetical protein
MTTLPPPKVKKAPEDSLESKVYTMVETFKEYIPTPNDRNRLSYCLFKYLNGEGDAPKILLKTSKINYEGISKEELAKKLDEGLSKIK